MDDGKKAAKDFVDKYFPQPSSKFNDVLSDLFPANSQQEYRRKQGYEGHGSKAQNATAATTTGTTSKPFIPIIQDGYSKGKASKSHNTPQKVGNAVVYCEVSEPCSMSSSVDYGSRDYYYPNAHANQLPGSSYEKKDKKDGYDFPDPEHSRGEWWQGSLYY